MDITQIQQSLEATTAYGTDLIQRVKFAILAFRTAPSLMPVIKLDDGTEIDLKSKTIRIDGKFRLHSTGDLHLSSDSHVLLNSNVAEGYHIHMNTVLDENDKPVYNTIPEENKKGDFKCQKK